jgi:hypothetical protein
MGVDGKMVRAVTASGFCSLAARFNYRAKHRPYRLTFLVHFFSLANQMSVQPFKLGHDRLLPHPSLHILIIVTQPLDANGLSLNY